jgi:serine/threonine protein kinase
MAVFSALNGEIIIDDKNYKIPDINVRKNLNKDCANGEIYAATDEIGSELIVKLWVQKVNDTRNNSEKAKREAQKLVKLDHPNIISISRFGKVGNYPFSVMREIKGVTLTDWLQKNPDIYERNSIWSQIESGLRYSYKQNVYHGDIHGKNILIGEDRKLKIIDFGTSYYCGADKAKKRDLRGLFKIIQAMLTEKYKKLASFDRRNKISAPLALLDAGNNILNFVIFLSGYNSRHSLHEGHGNDGYDYRNFITKFSFYLTAYPLVEAATMLECLEDISIPNYHIEDTIDYCQQLLIGLINGEDPISTIFRHDHKCCRSEFIDLHKRYVDIYLDKYNDNI